MNYLAHAFLSFAHPEIVVGNMIGDHIKGKTILETLPEGIKNGVILHRKIDEYTDFHPATQRAKTYFREDYRLYAGAFVDNLYDFFLANDPLCFADEQALFRFSLQVYDTVEQYQQYLPENFMRFFHYMKDQNWLYEYRTLSGIKRSFDRMAHRAEHIEDASLAYKTLVINYYTFNQCYLEIIDDMKQFCKETINDFNP